MANNGFKLSLSMVVAVGASLCVAADVAAFRDWPAGMDPKTVATRVSRQFLSGLEGFGVDKDWRYRPEGFSGNKGYGSLGRKNGMHYPIPILWTHALKCARLTGDGWLEKRLIEKFSHFYSTRACDVPAPYHVDMTVFGMLPLEIYRLNGDKRALELGLSMADNQWAKPQKSDFYKLTSGVIAQNFPLERQLELWKEGYSPQTRLWIDDMFMITAVQSHAYRATGDARYIERAAKEMVLYLNELQIRTPGKDCGLFYHAPDAPFLWARGDGWMAAGMAMLLKDLPRDNVHYARIAGGYRAMMKALYDKQDMTTGLWNQLVGDTRTWAETSGSGMFAYAFVEGVKNGLFGEEADAYALRARAAYLGLVRRLDNFGNLADVCVGTAKKNDYRHYVDRPRAVGDPHGQAPLLWVCESLMTVK
jgi:rhamnogalacturonyl hydrolase YesR